MAVLTSWMTLLEPIWRSGLSTCTSFVRLGGELGRKCLLVISGFA